MPNRDGTSRRALALARTAKQAQPDRAEISDTLGFVYMKKGAYELAVGALREAVSQAPENPRFRLRLGIALAKAGRQEEARARDRACPSRQS